MLTQRLRHRVTIQAPTYSQDATTGAVLVAWFDVLTDEPAEVVPLSGREFLQANTTQVEITARMTIRYQAGLDASMRVSFDGAFYQIVAVLPDPTARKHLTLMTRYLAPFAEDGEPSS